MKFRLLALTAFLFSMTSCFDVYETFNLDSNGGGTYVQQMDFTRAMAMANMMKGGAKTTGKPEQKMDSTFSLQAFTDTASDLTAAEKAALARATMHIQLDEATGEMRYTITYPFADAAQFDLIQQSFAKKGGNSPAMSALSNVFGQKSGGAMPGSDKTPAPPSASFTYKLSGNSIVKTVKPGTAKDTATSPNNEMPAEFKEMMKMSYTTTVNLPKEVKTWSGQNGTLSADKKQLRFKKQIDMDTKLTPADFDFNIQF